MLVLPNDETAILKALKIFNEGGNVIHATETCYGIACDMTNHDAVAKVFTIKQRQVNKPISALFESVEQAMLYVQWNDRAQELAKEYLPGPLTLILPLRSDAPDKLFPTPDGGETIGVRISSHPLAQKLVEVFGEPLCTTSANITGESSPYSIEEIERQFDEKQQLPDLIIDSGKLNQNAPSKVIDLSGKEESILRP